MSNRKLAQINQAILTAHERGDTEAAKVLAAEHNRLRELRDRGANEYHATGTGFSDVLMGQAKHGFDRMAYGVEQLLTGSINPKHQAQLEQGKAFVDKAGYPDIGGGIAEAIPSLATGTAVARLGYGFGKRLLAQGATGAAITPGGLGDRAEGAASAMVGEGVGTGLTAILARLARPINPTDAANRMIANGVVPTAGGSMGPAWKAAEDKLTSIPLIGDLFAKGRRDAVNEMNAAVLRRSGANVTPADAGYDGVRMAKDSFDRRYAEALEPMSFDMNNASFLQSLSGSLRDNHLSGESINRFVGGLNRFRGANNLDPLHFDPTTGGLSVSRSGLGLNPNAPPIGPGSLMDPANSSMSRFDPALIDGQTTQKFREFLRGQKAGYAKVQNDPLISETQLPFRDSIRHLDDGLRNQGLNTPQNLALWDRVNADYALTKPGFLASQAPAASKQNAGVFSPSELAAAIRTNAKNSTGGQSQHAIGQAPLQGFANDAVETLGRNVPDSGSAGRLGMTSLILGGGQTTINPTRAALLAIPAVLSSTALGRRYLSGQALPGLQNTVADALRGFSPYAGGLGAGTSNFLFSPDKTNSPWD
jgi:hypothetical protein